jgi:hypothetical protein
MRILDAGYGHRRNSEYLLRVGDELRGALLAPLETTVVQGLRSMTTWVLRKG